MAIHVHKFTGDKTIEEEARQWLIKLDGDSEPSQSDVAALREWVGRNPAHRKELLRISAFWDDASLLTELSIPLHAKVGREDRIGFFGRSLRSSPALGRVATVSAACVLAVGMAMAVWLFPQPITATNGGYATAIGELQVQTLADGSVVQINTDSQVQVDYNDTVRKIRLLRGEAHFEVSNDPDWPFEVYARQGVVKAVGTAFSVRLSDDQLKVTVSEGRVDLATVDDPPDTQVSGLANSEVRPSASSRPYRPALKTIGSLGHGQTASFSVQANITERRDGEPSGTVLGAIDTLAEQELARRLSWRDGYLVFAGDPLSQVVDEVNRYTPITINIADPALGQLRVGGRFKVGELDAMFDVLETSFGVTVSRLDDQHILLLSVQR